MAGERGRDDGHDQTYPPYAYGRTGWDAEASGYPGAADDARPPESGGYPSPEPYPPTPAGSYPPDQYAHDAYPAGSYPPDPYPRDGYPADPLPRDSYPPEPYQRYPPDPYPSSGAWEPRRPDSYSDPDPYPVGRPDGGGYRAGGYRPAGGQPVGEEPPPDRDGRRARRRLPLWQELPLLLVIAFCLAVLVRTFLLQAFYIPSGSMEDTLIAGDRVLVNKVVYNFREPARGEIVVFQGTDAWAPVGTGDADIGMFAKVGRTVGDLVGISRPGEKDFIKRVIGLPGDIVSCCDVDGRVFVNGQPLDESYVIRNSPLDDAPAAAQDCRSRRFDEVVVQPGQIFVMGDHRQVSQDSRCQGQVPIDNVIGRAFLIVWPNGRWGSLSVPDTFDPVPQPAAAGGRLVPVAGPADLAVVLPILVPVGWTLRADSGRSRFLGRGTRRRLAG